MAEKIRITAITVKGLFGLYDHHVALNLENRITILHGPNGVGKTVILKCLSALFRSRFYVLRATPFNTLSVELDDGTEIHVRRGAVEEDPGANESSTTPLSIEVKSGENTTLYDLRGIADVGELAKAIESASPYLVQIGKMRYLDQRHNRELTAEEVVDRYKPAPRSRNQLLGAERVKGPQPLRDLLAKVKIRFIETNRLYRVEEEKASYLNESASFTETVTEYARELRSQIESALASYGRQSQQLDQSFPQRLIQEEVSAFELPELKSRLEALEIRHQKLTNIGLLDKVISRPFDISSLDDIASSKLVPMTLYILDNEKKISVLDDLAGRIQLLLESVNRKLRNKRLVISRDEGLAASGAGGTLSLDSLSSGEQHEIVLLYELLFNTSEGTLVLIDEPELSLHVTWQKKFLPELMSITAKVGFDAIVATHSPFIVGGRLDLLVPLDAEPDTEEDNLVQNSPRPEDTINGNAGRSGHLLNK